ncbi:AEC family transporter [Rhodobacteraceae bacterium 2CG4]|uniref:AEC family transporter n=1 Tax=Halovulum marinum TaxID=2662447 RepID=A0A6L5Z091_9RHOB|nr:AEC family transporter [Halovulum marinum]MSU89530.1 AEC family transporter [Halovulum marinum]
MLEIFLRTLPFFLVVGCGYGAARARMFGPAEVAALTKFVFYFALSAMLFNFASKLPFEQIFNPALGLAYFLPTLALYLVVTAAALRRGIGFAEAAVEAQCGVIGNVGFLALPMLTMLLGSHAAGPILMILSIDLIFFGSLIVVILVAARGGAGLALAGRVLTGLLQNPMVMSMAAGLLWSALALPMPRPAADFLDLLGGAATPGALFAIGASLAGKSAERLGVALWLSTAKLILHPAAVGAMAWYVFDLPMQIVGVMIAAAAMPTAGNVYIIAQHYGVAPMRASSTILVSTTISVLTLSAVIALLN